MLNKIFDVIELGRIFEDSQIVRNGGYWPNGYITLIILSSNVKELSDGTGEDKHHLSEPMLNL